MVLPQPIRSLPQAIDWVQDAAQQRPDRNLDEAFIACLEGRRRRWPVIAFHGGSPERDGVPFDLPEVDMPPGLEGDLARELVSMLGSLRMDNPFSLNFSTGKGPGTLITCFGIPLAPEASDTPAYTRSIDDVLADPPPDPETSGLMPGIRQRIEQIQSLVPSTFKIRIADTQGPFNLAHELVGNDALTAPCLDPSRYHALMDRVTTLQVGAIEALRRWIGPDYRAPQDQMLRLRECSSNLTSRQFYEDFVLPYDLRVCEKFPLIDLHHCSGPHVLNQSLDLLPGITMVEAGQTRSMTLAAGWTPVDMAMDRIQGKPIVLNITQELPDDRELEFITEDLDRYESHPRLLFTYIGTHWWRPGGQICVRTLRRELEDYWDRKYVSDLDLVGDPRAIRV